MVANNELMSSALEVRRLHSQLLSKLFDLALNLSPSSLNSCSVSRELDRIFDRSGLEHRSLSCLGPSRWLRRENLVWGNSDLNSILLQVASQVALSTSEEWVELCRDSSELSVDIGGSFAGNLEDGVPSCGSGNGVALDDNIDSAVIILVYWSIIILNLRQLDSCTGLFLQCLNRGSLLSDDVGAGRLRNGNRHTLLYSC